MSTTDYHLSNSKLELNDFDDFDNFKKFAYLQHRNDDDLKLAVMNIRSLNSNFTEFEHFLDNINIEFDFIILTETWTKDIDLYKNRLSDYNTVSSDQSNREGGVIIFFRTSTVQLIDSSNDMIAAADSVSITFDYKNNKNKTLLAVYRSPANDPSVFTTSLDKWIRNQKVDDLLAVAGDFNICKNKYHTDKNTENLYDSLLEHSLLPVIHTNTRLTIDGKGSLIDQIFLNYGYLNSGKATYSGNYNACITHHKLQYLFMQRNVIKTINRNNRPLVRLHNDKNKEIFIKSVKNLQFMPRDKDTEPDELFEDFHSKLTRAYYESFPLVRVSRNKFRNQRWFDSECNRLFRLKATLHRKYCKSNNNEDKKKYNECNKKYKTAIRQAKLDYNKSLIDRCKNDVRQTWKAINSFLGKEYTSTKVRIELDNNIIEADEKIADAFNEHFNIVGSKYGCAPTGNQYLKFLGKRMTHSFFFTDITSTEVKKIIKSLKSRKATNDTIPLHIFKQCPDNVISHLTSILNDIIFKATMPNQLKKSKIIPIYKNGSRKDINNYRPISLLSYFDKILEKSINSRISNFLNTNNLICNNQFGFRQNHSTELALLSLLDRVYSSLDNKDWVMLISIDFRKAFEVINHNILLEKLNYIGIRGMMNKWFQSYLSNRRHQTLVNTKLSQSLQMKSGVPQGSSLGPLLFLIYINDLQNIFEESELNIFADDTALILRNKNLTELFNVANTKLSLLHEYLQANGIRLNETKTEYMIISPNRKIPELASDEVVYYDGKKIQKVDCTKLLGVYIDNKLTFKNHIDYLLQKKLRKFVPIFKQLRHYLTTENLLKIYHANVNSYLSYCLMIYHTGNTTAVHKIKLMQRRILKVLFRVHSYEVDNHMKRHKILDIDDSYKLKLLCLGHKMKYDNLNLPAFFQKIYKNKNVLNLRNKNDFIVAYHRLRISQRNTDYVIPREWNKLPDIIKNIPSYKHFSKAIKKILLDK